jgi:succinate dehydrogenase flavin-adding protein (antitoxin of CptAB toxin-antitoxin module)
MKELDVVLERYARDALPAMSSDERRVFAEFLDLPDPILLRYLLGHEAPRTPELAKLTKRITGARL